MTSLVISTPGVNWGEGIVQTLEALKWLLPPRSSPTIDQSRGGEWSRSARAKYRMHLLRRDATSGSIARRSEKGAESDPASDVQVQAWGCSAAAKLCTPKVMSITASSPQASAIFRDAIAFCAALPANLPSPRVSISDEGDISLQWSKNGKRAVADFGGDGTYGYALLRDGRIVPGEHDVESAAEVPSDLISYLRDMTSKNA